VNLTRREFLRSAGGVTFLALVPIGRGLFAAAQGSPAFSILPYIQPSESGPLARENARLLWQTGQTAEFIVRYGVGGGLEREATIVHAQRPAAAGGHRWNYAATLGGLDLGKRYNYEVECNGALLVKGFFTTRQPRGVRVRFAAFGDNSYGGPSDHAIAFQAYQARPDFIMNTGDNVYQSGLDNEYARYFFPVYNSDVAGPGSGAPLLRSVPYYSVLGNHDVRNKTPDGGPAADFSLAADSLGFYTNFHFPLGPASLRNTPLLGPDALLSSFRAAAGARFPRMANYSYDYGDVHFLCLDSNLYVDPADAALQAWIEQDLAAASDARWKFVVYHHPCFNVGREHWEEQQMRVLCPLFEKHGVDFVLSGHEHNYQRTRPLRFQPRDAAKASALGHKDRRVAGAFTLDGRFDGAANTRPDGILYITTGAGGNVLYDGDYNNDPSRWLLHDDGDARYVARMATDRHSLTVFDIDGGELLMRQIDEYGAEIDRIRVTKKV